MKHISRVSIFCDFSVVLFDDVTYLIINFQFLVFSIYILVLTTKAPIYISLNMLKAL